MDGNDIRRLDEGPAQGVVDVVAQLTVPNLVPAGVCTRGIVPA